MMVWIPKEPQYKPKPPKPTNTPTNTPTNLISRLDAIDAICKDWCNTTYKDCKTPFNQETDEYYHCDGCGDVETLLALPSTDASTDRPKGKWVESREQNILMAKRIEKGEAPTSSSEEFRGRLARSIKAAGRWMEDNAEGIVGAVEERRSLDIHLSWECSGNEIAPTINIDSDFICLDAIAEMHRKEIEK